MKSKGNRAVSRRRFLRGAALGAAFAAGGALLPRSSAASSRRQTVAVFGGGIAGLTAAHELAERGFDVTVYERRAWGGKARSTEVPGTGTNGRKDLPGEHGFRFELGFYRNLPDTLRRIPFGSNPNGVWDNVVEAPDAVWARDGNRSDFYVPFNVTDPTSLAPERLFGTLMTLLANRDFPPDATAYFVGRLVVLLSSCIQRRQSEFDDVSWHEFIAADRYGGDYRSILGDVPRFGQASKGPETSADWCGEALEGVYACLTGRGVAGLGAGFWRLLDGPTNETWIDPWVTQLVNSVRPRVNVQGVRPAGSVSATYACAIAIAMCRTRKTYAARSL